MEKLMNVGRIILVALVVFLLGVVISPAEEVKRNKVELTVYNTNLGLVKEERVIELPAGVSELTITDVASQIDATSVHFQSMTDPQGCHILEQNYEYDLINRNKLLEKYLDKEIILEKSQGNKEVETGEKTKETTTMTERTKATLLSISQGMVIKMGDEIQLDPGGRVILPSLPEGLITKPTLMWRIDNEKPGKHRVELSYLTGGIDWSADYIAITKKNGMFLNLASWVTVNNRTGTDYPDAKLKLMAGDVHRVEPRVRPVSVGNTLRAAEVKAPASFEEQPFFEYHLYTLTRPSTIKNNQIKQIEFISPRDIATQQIYFYDGIGPSVTSRVDSRDSRFTIESNKKVNVMLELTNSKENNLGVPLPKGKVRVYKEDPKDRSLEFVGEDSIEHTPKDEKVRLHIGDAFDIVGEHILVDFKKISDRVCEETFKIELRNHKDKDVEVRVIEHLYRWSNWEIIQKTQGYEKLDARTIQFLAQVPKDGKREITYIVRYSW